MVYNTGETSEELKQKYNPDGSLLRRAQLRMLDMVIYLDKVCSDLGIEYMIEGGNLLGAIRHGGFIPWDDDFDILVKRSDYERLCKYLRENPHHQYVLQEKKSDKHFLNYWNVLRDTKSEYLVDEKSHNMRIYRGLQIDIFPIENRKIKILTKISMTLGYRPTMYLEKGRIFHAHFMYNLNKFVFFPTMRMISRIFGNKKIWGYAYGLGWAHEFEETDLFPVSVVSFEGINFKSPNNPIEYCKKAYGNYMDLPPQDKRDHHHAKYRIWN